MLPLLIDENFNQRILRGLLRLLPHLNYVLVANVGLKGADDPTVLQFAAQENRIIVTHDVQTMPKFAYERIKRGDPMSGVIVAAETLPIGDVIRDLALIAECASASELESVVLYLPL